MSSRDCLSVLELLELKETGDEAAAAHVATCHRCQALLRTLRDADKNVIVPTGGGKSHLSLAHLREPADATDVRPGAVWVATGDEPGWTEVVAVVGRSRRDPRIVVVVPISDAVEDGTDLDVRLPNELLGYPSQAAAWNFGWLYAEQLVRPVGEIDDSLRSEITALYGWLVGAVAERPDTPHAAGPAFGTNDRRQLRREQEREQLLPLWRQVNRDQEPVDAQPEESIVSTQVEGAVQARSVLSFGEILNDVLAGEEWDALTLAEAVGSERSAIEKIASDQLDLTSCSDAGTVISIVHRLNLDLEELREPLMLSLSRSSGGEVHFDQAAARIAARAKPGASKADVHRDLFDRTVDQSPEARAKQAERYWQRLLELSDALGG